jgi:hypothetical protein
MGVQWAEEGGCVGVLSVTDEELSSLMHGNRMVERSP